MTQSQSLDYRIFFFPPSEIYQPLPQEDHMPFIRKADRRPSAVDRIGRENKGLLRLIHPHTEKKRVLWNPGSMEDDFDRPGSGLSLCSRSEASKQGKIEKKFKRKLKAFLRDEKKSKRIVHAEYMSSDKWRFFRKQIILDRGCMCERCGKSEHQSLMHVHHLTYARLGHELPDDVKLYCVGCHKLMHPGWE